MVPFAKQRTQNYTGIGGVNLQDQMITESMGPVQNRTAEHLGTSDGMLIQVRRRLIRAVEALRDEDTLPPCVENPEWYKVRSCIATLPKGVGWYDALHDWLYAKTNEIPDLQLAIVR